MAQRGRPPVYTGNVKRHIVGLIRKHGLTGARCRLNASPKSKLAKDRSLKLVPKPLGISMPTLGKLAEAANITLYRGRPSVAA